MILSIFDEKYNRGLFIILKHDKFIKNLYPKEYF